MIWTLGGNKSDPRIPLSQGSPSVVLCIKNPYKHLHKMQQSCNFSQCLHMFEYVRIDCPNYPIPKPCVTSWWVSSPMFSHHSPWEKFPILWISLIKYPLEIPRKKWPWSSHYPSMDWFKGKLERDNPIFKKWENRKGFRFSHVSAETIE